jgi:hypothetical protein
MPRSDDNFAPCSWCGEPVREGDAFRIFDGDDICHEGECSDEWRNATQSERAAE